MFNLDQIKLIHIFVFITTLKIFNLIKLYIIGKIPLIYQINKL